MSTDKMTDDPEAWARACDWPASAHIMAELAARFLVRAAGAEAALALLRALAQGKELTEAAREAQARCDAVSVELNGMFAAAITRCMTADEQMH